MELVYEATNTGAGTHLGNCAGILQEGKQDPFSNKLWSSFFVRDTFLIVRITLKGNCAGFLIRFSNSGTQHKGFLLIITQQSNPNFSLESQCPENMQKKPQKPKNANIKILII